MKNTILAFLATVGLAITACDNAGNKSTTGFVEAALMPYVGLRGLFRPGSGQEDHYG